MLGGLFVALATMLVVLVVSRGGGDPTTTGASGTTGIATTLTSTSISETTTSLPASTTTATTSTAPPTTTTAAPFTGTLDQKTGVAQGAPAGRLVGIRFAAHEGYTRVVFDFASGGTPGYWIGYDTADALTVLFYPMDLTTPYDPGVFDTGGSRPIGEGSVLAVHDAGRGGGSGEWGFAIVLTGQKPFSVGTLADPPRIYVDVAD